MSSHRVHFFHLVWSTKDRRNWLLPKIQKQLYPYMGGIIKKTGKLLEIGGMADHVHLLVELSNLDHFTSTIQNVKTGSSFWLKKEFMECKEFAWQSGYGSFSVSYSQLDLVRAYIRSQEEHHKKTSYENEYLKLLKLHQAEFNEQYLFG